jgi:tRNA dimethylallyltransferase
MPLVCIMGPTASGKTDLAVRLVERFPFEIISVDSAMVYRGMDIGTAKPGREVQEVAPHRLIDILDPADSYSAARFREDALREAKDIRRKGRWPLLVGGTLLYFRTLERGLADLPDADPEVRRRLEAEAAVSGWAALHARLAVVDPGTAARIHPNDPQRIQRALEVYELSGQPMTALLAEGGDAGVPLLKLALIPQDRSGLHTRIENRFHRMLEDGLVEEVQRLFERGDLGPDLPSIRAVGYRQVWNYLRGALSYGQMIECGIYATRQYAKRQITWLRSEQNLHWIESESAGIFDAAKKVLDSALPIGDLDR